jgi:hypothetical protein
MVDLKSTMEESNVHISSVEEVLAQRPKRSTYKTVIANPYLFGVALVSDMRLGSSSPNIPVGSNY